MMALRCVSVGRLALLLTGGCSPFSMALRTSEDEMATTFGKALADRVSRRGD